MRSLLSPRYWGITFYVVTISLLVAAALIGPKGLFQRVFLAQEAERL